MIIKYNNVEFISFSDGVCDIYSEDNEGLRKYKYRSLGFNNKILGYKRIFAAKTAQTQIDSVIKIPMVNGVDNYDIVEIQGIGRFKLEVQQPIHTTNPKSIDLTLKQLEIFGDKNG